MLRLWIPMAPALLALSLLGQNGQQPGLPTPSPVPAFVKFEADFKVEMSRYSADVKALTATDEYKAALEKKDREAQAALRAKVKPADRASFVQRAQKEAEALSGKDEAVPFLCWVANVSGDKEATKAAVDALLAHHTKSPRLGEFVERVYAVNAQLGGAATVAMLDQIAADSPYAGISAWSKYNVAMLLGRDKTASDADKARVEGLKAEAGKLAVGTDLALRIAAPAFEKERLQIGMTAPEIEGVDPDGTAFKLSDYRGKVVVVDFWGFW